MSATSCVPTYSATVVLPHAVSRLDHGADDELVGAVRWRSRTNDLEDVERQFSHVVERRHSDTEVVERETATATAGAAPSGHSS
jgi:hypothetical protein